MELITHIKTDASALISIPIIDNDMLTLINVCVLQNREKLIKRPEITVFGKPCKQPRDVGFFSNDSAGYKYSGKTMHAQPLSPELLKLLNDVNTMLHTDFNAILINAYVDGNDCVGKHSDDESGLSNGIVACISVGAVRKFRIRNKTDNQIVADVPTTPNYILIMNGDFQKEFTHEIPVEKKVKNERISLTFRKHAV